MNLPQQHALKILLCEYNSSPKSSFLVVKLKYGNYLSQNICIEHNNCHFVRFVKIHALSKHSGVVYLTQKCELFSNSDWNYILTEELLYLFQSIYVELVIVLTNFLVCRPIRIISTKTSNSSKTSNLFTEDQTFFVLYIKVIVNDNYATLEQKLKNVHMLNIFRYEGKWHVKRSNPWISIANMYLVYN